MTGRPHSGDDPTIYHVPPYGAYAGRPITVAADVVCPGGLATCRVTLGYRKVTTWLGFQDDPFTQVSMTLRPGAAVVPGTNRWEAQIPAAVATSTGVDYHIWAEDYQGTQSWPVSKSCAHGSCYSDLYYRLDVLSSSEIVHAPPPAAYHLRPTPLRFQAHCSDAKPCLATVWYRTSPAVADPLASGSPLLYGQEPTWATTQVRDTALDPQGDGFSIHSFEAVIPGSAAQPSGFDYLIKVTDTDTVMYWPPGTPWDNTALLQSQSHPQTAHHVNVQAFASEILWGVDSVVPVTQASLDATPTNWGDPAVWARYLHDEGKSAGLEDRRITPTERDFIRTTGIPILVIDYNPGTDMLETYDSAKAFAEKAVRNARAFGIPETVGALPSSLTSRTQDRVPPSLRTGFGAGSTGSARRRPATPARRPVTGSATTRPLKPGRSRRSTARPSRSQLRLPSLGLQGPRAERKAAGSEARNFTLAADRTLPRRPASAPHGRHSVSNAEVQSVRSPQGGPKSHRRSGWHREVASPRGGRDPLPPARPFGPGLPGRAQRTGGDWHGRCSGSAKPRPQLGCHPGGANRPPLWPTSSPNSRSCGPSASRPSTPRAAEPSPSRVRSPLPQHTSRHSPTGAAALAVLAHPCLAQSQPAPHSVMMEIITTRYGNEGQPTLLLTFFLDLRDGRGGVSLHGDRDALNDSGVYERLLEGTQQFLKQLQRTVRSEHLSPE